MLSLSQVIALANSAIQSALWPQAIEQLRVARELAPSHPGILRTYVGVLANAAAGYSRTKQHNQALALAQEALSLDPTHRIAQINLAASLLGLGRFSDAQTWYQKLVDSDPADDSLRSFLRDCVLGAAEQELADNNWRSAHARLAPIAAEHVQAGLRQLALPMVYESQAQVQASRAEFAQRLDQLIEQRYAINSLEELVHVNFRLAYQGLDDTALQSRYGDWLCQSASAFQPKLAPCVARRVGLVSSFFRECTVGSYFASWISIIRKLGFEVELYQLGPSQDAWTQRCIESAHRGAVLTGSLSDIAQQIAERGLELLIYPELGMDGRTFVLASLTLARKQACAWGHPVTSGLPSMDAYLSAASMEPENAAQHYREALHLLPGIGTHYRAPKPPPRATRAELGLPNEATPLVLLPQSPFKLLPANDARMLVLAHAEPDCEFVLFEGLSAGVTQAIQTRLHACFVKQDINPNRLHFLPMGSRERFLQVNQQCQLMLDSIGFSGGNTSIDALLCDLPIWLAPGGFMRSRQSLAMTRLLGLSASELNDGERFRQALQHLQTGKRAGADPEQMQHLLQPPDLSSALARTMDAILRP